MVPETTERPERVLVVVISFGYLAAPHLSIAATLRNPSGCLVSWEDGPGSVCIGSQRALPPDVMLSQHCGKVRLTTGFLQLAFGYAGERSWGPACPSGVQGGPLSRKHPPPLAWSRDEQRSEGPMFSGTNIVCSTQKLGFI